MGVKSWLHVFVFRAAKNSEDELATPQNQIYNVPNSSGNFPKILQGCLAETFLIRIHSTYRLSEYDLERIIWTKLLFCLRDNLVFEWTI